MAGLPKRPWCADALALTSCPKLEFAERDMKPRHQLDELDITRQAERLRAETFAGWMRSLRRRIGR